MATDRTSALLALLSKGVSTSAEVQTALDLSQTSASRLLRELISAGRIVRLGSTRGARYGLLRPVRNVGARWGLRQIGADGNVRLLGELDALAANQYGFRQASTIRPAVDEVTQGLPYLLQDQRPGGFLGRAVSRRFHELELPERVVDWSDDHYLQYLTRRGSDTIGDLILGDESFNRYVELQNRLEPMTLNAREHEYPRLAQDVMSGGLPGSSAHGEQPKFTSLLRQSDHHQHVLVKFSPPTKTIVGQRWSDLLVAEHLAHELLAGSGISAVRSQIHQFAGATFLQMDRFDRCGVSGRLGITSLLAIENTMYGMIDNWIASAARLHADGRIDAATLETVRLIYTFGGLIANTDRHFGNLSLFDRYDGRFQLAPVYDMLPMLFAPQSDEIVTRSFEPPDPTSLTMPAYRHARELAERYWQQLSADQRLSQGFREIAAGCGETIAALPRTGAYAYSGQEAR